MNTVQQITTRIRQSYGSQPIPGGEEDYIQRHARRYVRTLDLLPAGGGALLDVGCFPGHLSLLAAARGWAVTGLSKLDGTFLGPAFGQRMAALGVRVLHADIERDEFPCPDNAFDAVFFNETAEHLAYNPFHPLDQIWRVLKPGGTRVFSVPNFARFDHRWALLKGRTLYPALTKPLGQSFHADLGQRHIREYTRRECRHLLAEQDKYLYRFDIRRTIMDRSSDGLAAAAPGRRARPGTLLRALFSRLAPNCRSTIFMVAVKPSDYLRLDVSDVTAQGFHPPEVSGTDPAFVRRPLEAAWLSARGSLTLRHPAVARGVTRLDLLMWLPGPAGLAPRQVRVQVNDAPAATLTVAPSPEPRRFAIPIPPAGAATPRGDTLRVAFETEGWKPADFGMAGDPRTLGVMIGLKPLALMCKPVPIRQPGEH